MRRGAEEVGVEIELVAEGLVVVERDLIGGLLRVTCPRGQEEAWIAITAARPDVRFSERNGIGQGGYVPNDTFHPAIWHHNNTGQSGDTAGADIETQGVEIWMGPVELENGMRIVFINGPDNVKIELMEQQ